MNFLKIHQFYCHQLSKVTVMIANLPCTIYAANSFMTWKWPCNCSSGLVNQSAVTSVTGIRAGRQYFSSYRLARGVWKCNFVMWFPWMYRHNPLSLYLQLQFCIYHLTSGHTLIVDSRELFTIYDVNLSSK